MSLIWPWLCENCVSFIRSKPCTKTKKIPRMSLIKCVLSRWKNCTKTKKYHTKPTPTPPHPTPPSYQKFYFLYPFSPFHLQNQEAPFLTKETEMPTNILELKNSNSSQMKPSKVIELIARSLFLYLYFHCLLYFYFFWSF